MLPLVLALAVAGHPVSASVTVQGDSTSGLDLTGTWLLLEGESDDLDEKMAEWLSSGPRGGTGWQAGPYSGGTSAGTRGRSGGPTGRSNSPAPQGGINAPGGVRAQVEEIFRALQVLQIDLAEDGRTLRIRDAARNTRELHLDGRTVGDSFTGEVTARLEGEALVVETRAEPRRRSERFTRSQGDDGAPRLVLESDLSLGLGSQLDLRTVYERVAGGGELVRAPGTERRTDSRRAEVLPPVSPDPSTDDRTPGEGARARAEAASSSSGASRTAALADPPQRSAVIRLLPPEGARGQLLTGRVLLETLNVDPTIQTVEFLLDGERFERRVLPPWEAKVELADPPREQTVEVKAYGPGERLLGSDTLVLNRLDPRFSVRLTGLQVQSGAGAIEIQAAVSVPRDALLEGVTFYRNQERLGALTSEVDDPSGRGAESIERFAARFESPPPTAQDFVRVVARLDDGRELEDVRLVQDANAAGGFAETLDVQLVRLQVLVVDGRGAPVTDLRPEDFEVREGGRRGRVYPVDQVSPSTDTQLALGMAIDSSGSMRDVWERTRQLTAAFLEQTLSTGDRVFVVDFDQRLRLLQPLTGDLEAARFALDRLQPEGGTALYDSVLFSLLQFGDVKGRKALVVFTDGFDSDSRADPQRAIEFGQRLGVPVYVIALSGSSGSIGSIRRGSPGAPEIQFAEVTARSNLRLITEPTGGRLFQVASLDQVEAVYRQIEAELRSQLIVSYYSERGPGDGADARPELRVLPKGLKVRTALPIELVEDP
ncbi:MAG: VWA domain-containing protein [Acidobacteria bacterium]|nr:MAG: VWA domain-containing protein [Acidobacteriota bacterium]REK08559.1 MAG: VWA domain-containing protein [Acidobacteriota bacterium]